MRRLLCVLAFLGAALVLCALRAPLHAVLRDSVMVGPSGADDEKWKNGYTDCSEFQNLRSAVPAHLCSNPTFEDADCAVCELDPITYGMAPFITEGNVHVQAQDPSEHECHGAFSFGKCINGVCVVMTTTPDNCSGTIELYELQNHPGAP